MDTKNIVENILEGADVREAVFGPVIKKRVIRNGKLQKIRTHKVHRKVGATSAARRRAILKAHIAASKPSAIARRKRSLKLRKAFECEDAPKFYCPDCGKPIAVDSDGFFCPNCGEDFILVRAPYLYGDSEDYQDYDDAEEHNDYEDGDYEDSPEEDYDGYEYPVPEEEDPNVSQDEDSECGNGNCSGKCGSEK